MIAESTGPTWHRSYLPVHWDSFSVDRMLKELEEHRCESVFSKDTGQDLEPGKQTMRVGCRVQANIQDGAIKI